MTRSPLTDRVQITSDSSSRFGVKVDRFIVHHAATTSLDAILTLFQPGGRTVSANYALGSDGTLVNTVDEDRRAWTSSSAHWDGRAVTIEVANSYAGDPWPVSDKAFDKLARLIADVATRHGFPINDDTILTHQELYKRYGASYPTACPGDLQRRKAELLTRARRYQSSAPAGGGVEIIEQGDIEMRLIYNTENEDEGTRRARVGEHSFLVLSPQAAALERKLWGAPVNVNNWEWNFIKKNTQSAERT